MKKLYQEPKVEVEMFDIADVITTSCTGYCESDGCVNKLPDI